MNGPQFQAYPEFTKYRQGPDYSNIVDPILKVGEFANTIHQQGVSNDYRSQLLQLQKDRDQREQQAHNYEYGTPPDTFGQGGGTMDASLRHTLGGPGYSSTDYGSNPPGDTSQGMGPTDAPVMGPEPQGSLPSGYAGPQPSGYVPQGTPPPANSGSYDPSQAAPGQAPGRGPAIGYGGHDNHIDGWNAWMNDQRGQTPYSQLVGGMGQGNGDIGAKRRAEAMQYSKDARANANVDSEINLRNAQSKWYNTRYTGGPGGRGGSGANDPSKMTTANLTALRHQVSQEVMYAIPGSDDYNAKLDYMQQLDDELQNRMRINATPRPGGTAPASPAPEGGSGAGAGSPNPVTLPSAAMNALRQAKGQPVKFNNGQTWQIVGGRAKRIK